MATVLAALAIPSAAAAAPETIIGDALAASPTLTPPVPVSSDTGGATFECRVNGTPAGWASCDPTSGTYGTGLAFVNAASNALEIRAVASGTPDPSPVTTYIWTDTSALLPGFTMSTSDTRAALKADIQLDLTVKGGYNPKTLNFDLPPGMTVAYTGTNELCSMSSALAGTCASTAPQSMVGSASAVGISPSAGTWAAASTGNLFLTESPSGAAPGGVALDLSVPGGLGTIRAVGEIRIKQTSNGTSGGLVRQTLTFPSLPQTTSSTARFHLNSLRLNLTGDPAGGSWRFIANPTTCPAAAAQLVVSGTTYGTDGSNLSSGSAIPASSVNYPVTACATTTFKPTIASEFFQTDPLDGSTYDPSNPSASLRGLTSSFSTRDSLEGTRTGDFGFIASVFTPWSGRRLKDAQIALPISGGVSYGPVLGTGAQRCTGTGVSATALWAGACPTNGIAQVGSFSISSPLWPEPLVGKLSVVSKAPIPWFGIDINPSIPGNPPGVTLRFLIVHNYEGTPGRTTFRLANLPDLPMYFDLDFSGLEARAGGLLSSLIFNAMDEGDQYCVSADSVRAEFTSVANDAPVVKTSAVAVEHC